MSEKYPVRDLHTGFVQHLRRQSKGIRCARCPEQFTGEGPLKDHLRLHLPNDLDNSTVERNLLALVQESKQQSQSRPREFSDIKRPADGEELGSNPDFKRQRSETPETPPVAPTPAVYTAPRSRARPVNQSPHGDDPNAFVPVPRKAPEGRGLWQEHSTPASRPAGQTAAYNANRPRPHPAGGGGAFAAPSGAVASASATDQDIPEDPSAEEMIKQPETRPISQEQLVAEVKGIYAGLVMVESKCIEVDNAQNSLNDTSPPLNPDQWQALIALHRTLLHEHHDFFLASQHPSASPALRRLAAKYAMPARMWRHGIHSFLELLRHRLPLSLEYMLTFIYLAYSMMALLYETVPAFEDTWIECLGDLSRYRMAIEDDDIRDREVWTATSRHWYSTASDKAPTTGRLHHHLAILARPNAVEQLYYYVKSLCVPIPFNSARESILTLFDPIISGNQPKLPPVESAFVCVHAVFFTEKKVEDLENYKSQVFSGLDVSIARLSRRWLSQGCHMALSNIGSILEYGSPNNVLMKLIASGQSEDTPMAGTSEIGTPSAAFKAALDFSVAVDRIALARLGDSNILSYLHCRLFFLEAMSRVRGAMAYLEESFPWALAARAMNSFTPGFERPERYESHEWPKNENRPLPDDYAMRGWVWSERTFPIDHFAAAARISDDEKSFETPSMSDHRKERIFHFAWRLAQRRIWIAYDTETKQFKPLGSYALAIDPLVPTPAAEGRGIDADGDSQMGQQQQQDARPKPTVIIQ